MAKQVVTEQRMSIRQACQTFSVSETCYRYQHKMANENTQIANWLIRLTHEFCISPYFKQLISLLKLQMLNILDKGHSIKKPVGLFIS